MEIKKATKLSFETAVSWIKNKDDHFQWSGSDFNFSDKSDSIWDKIYSDCNIHSYKVLLGEVQVGYGEIHLLEAPKHSYRLVRVIINPSFRKKGIGENFVKELSQISKNTYKAKRLDLIVLDENIDAVCCYIRSDFKFESIMEKKIKENTLKFYTMVDRA